MAHAKIKQAFTRASYLFSADSCDVCRGMRVHCYAGTSITEKWTLKKKTGEENVLTESEQGARVRKTGREIFRFLLPLYSQNLSVDVELHIFQRSASIEYTKSVKNRLHIRPGTYYIIWNATEFKLDVSFSRWSGISTLKNWTRVRRYRKTHETISSQRTVFSDTSE